MTGSHDEAFKKITLIGWSWGAMMAGYYASLPSDSVRKLVLYAPLYNFNNNHTNSDRAALCGKSESLTNSTSRSELFSRALH